MRVAVDNAADAGQVREATRKEKSAEDLARADWKALLADPAGRRRIWQVLQWCGTHRLAFTTDALTMAFRTGEQNIGLQLITAIEAANPAALVELMRDAAIQEQKNG
jgi:hypothetical protein